MFTRQTKDFMELELTQGNIKYMASRPIFCPLTDGLIGVKERLIDFKWHAGLAVSQKQKSIRELHQNAKSEGISSVLEISSKSEEEAGIKLSAFNLCITTRIKKQKFTVETAFQSSKVFDKGGPYIDLLGLDSKSAKDDRLKNSGNLIHFEFFGQKFPNRPLTYFYDFIYINALVQNPDLSKLVQNYSGFSDIEFNPKKSINCQAYSAALYLSLLNNNCLEKALVSPENFLVITLEQYKKQVREKAIQQEML